MSLGMLITLLLLTQTLGIDGLSLAEVPAYASALTAPIRLRPTPVTFRELWGDPKPNRDRTVEVSGQIARVFRAPAQGALPPRLEVWLAQGQNLICVVVPDQPAMRLLREGRIVVVSGRFLGLVRYASADGERLAPLIVGPGPPRDLDGGKSSSGIAEWSASAWTLAAVVSLVTAGFLARVHSRGVSRPRPPELDGVEFHS